MVDKKRVKLKICLLGDPAVGKTSLVQKYIYNLFSDSYIRTMGTKVSRKLINYHDPEANIDYEIIMMLWDIMGQQFSSMPLDKYFKMSHGALIVCDITRKETLNNLIKWKDKVYAESGEIPIIYLANKIDLGQKQDITPQDFSNFCEKENIEYYLTSAKTGENVEIAFNRLGELIVRTQGKPGTTKPKEKVDRAQIEDFIQRTVKYPSAMSISGTSSGLDESYLASIKPGSGYLIREEKPIKSFEILKKMVQNKIKGLCISRKHPKSLEEEFGLKDLQVSIPMYWLSTEAQQKKNILAPTFLPQINAVITEYIQKNDNVIILLEGIEYLIEKNDFKAILNLIHSLNDYIMGSNARLIIPIDPLTLKEQEMHMLSRELKYI